MIAHPDDPYPVIGSMVVPGLHEELKRLALSAAKAVDGEKMSTEERAFLDLTVARLNVSMFSGEARPTDGQVKAAWGAAYRSRSEGVNNRAFRAALACMYAEHSRLDPQAARKFARMVINA